MGIVKNLLSLLIIGALFSSYKFQTLKGTWNYLGGIYKGKTEQASKEYTLQRKYDNEHFDAYLLEPKHPPYKYQSGNYLLKADSCLETETFSAQTSQLTGLTIRYRYAIYHDTLKLSGVLPNGNSVEEYWLRSAK